MSTSLLDYIEAPVVVGDQDGSAAYVNPAFASRFGVAAADVRGKPLSKLFDGGAREAVLVAVARVCSDGETERFRIRHGGFGYAAIASPIEASEGRVGFVVLFAETSSEDERLQSLRREMREPVNDLTRVLDEVLEQTGGRRDERYRELVEDGLRGLAQLRKWIDELERILSGNHGSSWSPGGSFDPVRAVADAVRHVSSAFAARNVNFDVQLPDRLPWVPGDGSLLELAIVQLLQDRLENAAAGSTVAVTARSVERNGNQYVMIGVVDGRGDGVSIEDPGEPIPDTVLRTIQELGGEIRSNTDLTAGRTTAIRLGALKQ